jgi:hypothetical protein
VEIGIAAALSSDQQRKIMAEASSCPAHRSLRSEVAVTLALRLSEDL